jgi:hypothetical protein
MNGTTGSSDFKLMRSFPCGDGDEIEFTRRGCLVQNEVRYEAEPGSKQVREPHEGLKETPCHIRGDPELPTRYTSVFTLTNPSAAICARGQERKQFALAIPSSLN